MQWPSFSCCVVNKAEDEEPILCFSSHAFGDEDISAIGDYASLLLSDRWQTRKEAVLKLGKLGPHAADQAGPLLQRVLLRDDHWEVRQFAATVIGDLGFTAVSDAREALQEATNDSYRHVRDAAKQTLLRFGELSEEEDPEREGSAEPLVDRHSPPDPPVEFCVILEKGPADKLGLDIEWRSGNSLRVLQINPGLVQAWNSASTSFRIEPGDLVVELNGLSGDSKELVKEILKAQRLVMRLQKGSGNAGDDSGL